MPVASLQSYPQGVVFLPDIAGPCPLGESWALWAGSRARPSCLYPVGNNLLKGTLSPPQSQPTDMRSRPGLCGLVGDQKREGHGEVRGCQRSSIPLKLSPALKASSFMPSHRPEGQAPKFPRALFSYLPRMHYGEVYKKLVPGTNRGLQTRKEIP